MTREKDQNPCIHIKYAKIRPRQEGKKTKAKQIGQKRPTKTTQTELKHNKELERKKQVGILSKVQKLGRLSEIEHIGSPTKESPLQFGK